MFFTNYKEQNHQTQQNQRFLNNGVSFLQLKPNNVTVKTREITKVNPEISVVKETKKMDWGEPTWFLFHTLAEKVKEEEFQNIRVELLNIIYSICSNLPCPVCSTHAKQHLNGTNFNNIQTKQQLKDFFFHFHNIVNQRKYNNLHLPFYFL